MTEDMLRQYKVLVEFLGKALGPDYEVVLQTIGPEGSGIAAIAKAAGGRCAVFAGQDGDYRYAVIESGGDLRQFIKDMNTALHGRGGGRDGFAQGSAACTAEEVRAFFQAR